MWGYKECFEQKMLDFVRRDQRECGFKPSSLPANPLARHYNIPFHEILAASPNVVSVSLSFQLDYGDRQKRVQHRRRAQE